MGDDEKYPAGSGSSRLVEIIKEYSPSAAGLGVGLGTFLLANDMPVIIYGIGEVARMPAVFGGVTGAVFGMLAYNLSNHILFKPKKERVVEAIDDIIEEISKKEQENEISKPRKILDTILEHPKTLALMSILPRIVEVSDAAYKFIYRTGHIMHFYQTHAEQIIAKHGIEHYNEIINQCDMVIKGGAQTILNGSLLSFGQFVVLTYGFILLNSLLNSKYSAVTSRIIKGEVMAKTNKYKNKGVSLLEETLRILPLRETYATLSGIFLEENNFDDALLYSSKALKTTNRDFPFYTLYERAKLFVDPSIREFKKTRRRVRKDPSNPENYLRLSLVHYKREEFSRSVSAVEKAEQLAPDDPGIKFFAGELLERIGRHHAAEQKWSEAIHIILKDPEKRFERIGESTNQVLEYSSSRFIKGTVVFKRGQEKDLEAEIELSSESKRLVSGRTDYGTVTPINTFEFYGDRNLQKVYVMKRDEGEKLSSYQGKDEGLFLRVADFLALIHAGIPAEKSRKGRLDMLGTIKGKLSHKDLSLPEKVANKILDNYEPILSSLAGATYIFNKDANPENWIIRADGRIVAIDWEDKGLVPMQFDLANLLEYGSIKLSSEQKDHLIGAYLDSYEKYKGEPATTEKDKFMLGYLNAVVHRAICFCSVWSSPERPSMRERRAIVIDNAISSLCRIMTEFDDYYAIYKENYDALYDSLKEMKSLVFQHEQ